MYVDASLQSEDLKITSKNKSNQKYLINTLEVHQEGLHGFPKFSQLHTL